MRRRLLNCITALSIGKMLILMQQKAIVPYKNLTWFKDPMMLSNMVRESQSLVVSETSHYFSLKTLVKIQALYDTLDLKASGLRYVVYIIIVRDIKYTDLV